MERTSFGVPLRLALMLGLLFAIATLAYSALWPRAPVVAGDTSGYMDTAADLQGDADLDELQDRPPGYPLVLIFTGSVKAPTRLLFYVQLVMHFSSIWLVSVLMQRFCFKPVVIAVFCGVALLPPYVQDTAYVLSETTAAFFVVLAVFALVTWVSTRRTHWMWLAGTSFAYALLVRPVFVALAVALAAVLGAMKYVLGHDMPRLKHPIVALCVPTLLSAGTLSLINYASFDYFGVTPLVGYNLSTRTARFVEQLPDEFSTIRHVMVRHRDLELVEPGSSHTATQYIFSARPELLRVTKLDEARLARMLVRANLSLIRAHPLQYLEQVGFAASRFWLPYVPSIEPFNRAGLQLLLAGLEAIVIGAFFVQLFVMGGSGVVRALQRRVRTVPHVFNPSEALAYLASITAILCTWLVSSAMDVGNSRFRSPVMLLLLLSVVLAGRAFTDLTASRLTQLPER